jgi:hypothetical protein
MTDLQAKTIFHPVLADDLTVTKTLTKTEVELLFNFFKNSSLFNWKDANNSCESRANAICILLDQWNVPNYKGWVFSGQFLKKEKGYLKNCWNYHVAAAIPVQEESSIDYYIIDPSTSEKPELISNWAANVTAEGCSYYFIKSGATFIYRLKKIQKDNWFERNKENYKWTIQGLCNINGVSGKGKAQLRFNKNRILNMGNKFKRLAKAKPLV